MTTFTDDELIYAATERCECGAGMAYGPHDIPEGVFCYASCWDCSDILTGRAIPSGEPGAAHHSDVLPFSFWKVLSEDEVRAEGRTTRPGGSVERQAAR